MRGRIFLAVAGCLAIAILGSPGAAKNETSKSKPKDPNEKICEDITMVGSRLAVKRICATRSEWAERRREDRMVIDNAQIHAADPCNTVNTHSGGAAC